MISSLLSKMLLALIKGYQLFVSPVLPARCRYYPTCSQYGITAISWHGPGRGGLLTLKRLSRCHPMGGQGIDFVPLPLYKTTFKPLTPSLIFAYRALPKCSNTDVECLHSNFVSRETVVIERGVYRDISSYSARLNAYLNTN